MAQQVSNLAGKTFGFLTVLARTENVTSSTSGKTYVVWKCVCVCGNVKNIHADDLKRKGTISCGCYRRNIFKATLGANGLSALYSRYKRHSEKHNRVFELSKETFKEITLSNCFYCDAKPTQICKVGTNRTTNYYEHSTYIYNGVDRLNSSHGYTPSNVVACCKQCNYAKSNLSVEDFLDLIKRIYTFKKLGVAD